MKAPAFWYSAQKSALAQALRPAAHLYGLIAARLMRRPGARLPAPVITIGNFVAGGAGKTPAAMAVARLLVARGEKVAFLSRGYGGSIALRGEIAFVDGAQDARDTGDEPLLLARVAPTFVGRDRGRAASFAIDALGVGTLILDDGLQSRRVEPDIALAIVDGATGIGNGLCLPAGPLRAPLAAQLPHVHGVVIVGEGAAGAAVAEQARAAGLRVFFARLDPGEEMRALRGAKVVAFAGIGLPDKFFASLESCGAEIVARRPFPDHHFYRESQIVDLRTEARAAGALLVTTEKDFVRLPPLTGDGPKPIALPVWLSFADAPAVTTFLTARLKRARGLPG